MKPILFNTEMVKAILEDRKTVTRRSVKPQPISSMFTGVCTESTTRNDKTVGCFMFGNNYGEVKERTKPPYKVGDNLYVRETWQCLNPYSDKEYVYKASCDVDFASDIGKWMPSIHMPREAARIFLKVTNVGVERLQEIAEEQAMQEGINEEWARSWWKPTFNDSDSGGYPEYRKTFAQDLWNLTIKKSDINQYGWSANPWVWVIEFERIEKENL